MLSIIRKLIEKTNNVNRSMYFWNTFNATLSAAQSALILMVMTRTNGVKDAGIFSIAYAVGSLMLFVGQYGLRRFQASDVKEQFKYSDYIGVRIITCTAMLIASLFYSLYGIFFNDYTTEKFMVVFLVCILKIIQAFADVYHGRMQQKGRLDVAAKSSAIRVICGTLSYMLSLVVTHNLIISTIVCVVVSFIVFMLTTVNVATLYGKMKPSFHCKPIKGLLIAGFPLFMSYFLSLYVGNAPKYAIDAYLSDEIQAYYNFVFMPAFAIQLLANFIFNPILTSYARLWSENKFKRFKKAVRRQMVIVLGITILGLAGSYLVGIPILSLFFGVDLSSYRMELCMVMLGGGMLAYVTFFTTVITIIRHQNALLFGYAATAIAAKVLSKFFVLNYGIMGAAGLYTILMGMLSIVFFVVMMVKIKKDMKIKSAGLD